MKPKFILYLVLVLNFAQANCLFAQTSPITNGAEWENGLPVALPNAQRPKVETVFISRPGTNWTYSHHPHLIFFKGRFYAIWSNGRKSEDQPGQRVLISSADNFTNWTAPRPLVDTVVASKGYEEILTASGLYQHDGTLIAYVGGCGPRHRQNQFVEALTTTDGEHWSAPRGFGITNMAGFNHSPKPIASGRLLVAVNKFYPWSDNLSGLGPWSQSGFGWAPKSAMKGPNPPPDDETSIGSPGEGAFFQTDDGVIHMLLRNDVKDVPHRLWVSESRDNGLTWSEPVPTGFSDASSKFNFDRLPDGRFYYVGNPLSQRTPLVLSLSKDGVHFNQHYILAAANRRLPKNRDEYGYPAYPDSMVHGGYLYVIVSRDKNKIEVLRVALSELK